MHSAPTIKGADMRSSLVPHTHVVDVLPFQMRHARFMTAPAGQDDAGAPTGAAGDAAAAAQQAAQQANGGQVVPGQGQGGDDAAQRQQQQATSWPEWDGKVESLPEPVQQAIRAARDDAAKQRRSRANAEGDVVTKIAEALGLDPKVLGGGDATPTVESLTATVAQREQETAAEKQAREQAEREAAEARREAAVLRVSARLRNVDGDALLDSREFMRSIGDVDATDVSAVEKAVKEYAAKYPRFQVRVTGASAVDHTAGSGTGTTRPDYSLEEATARTMQGLN